MGPPGIRIEGDPSERLAQAREVLADPTAVGRSIGALATLLEQAPEEGRQRVLALLEGEDPGARAAAAAAIWSSLRQEPPLPAATLVEFFERGDGDARFAAASVLAAGGDESLLGRWREERASDLKSAEVATRLRAIRELAQLRDEQTTGLLLPLLSDGSEEVRIAVLRSLSGGRQDRDLVDSLRPLEEDASPRVARAARRLVEDLERRRKRP